MYTLSLLVTKFADQAVILPLALFMAFAFCLCGWWRGAKGWLFALFVTLLAIIVAKLLVHFVAANRLPFDLSSPSAHVATGGIVYGSLVALLLRGGRTTVHIAIAAACLFALCFGITRVYLNTSSLADVIIGWLFGIAGIVVFFSLTSGTMPRNFHRIRFAIGATFVIVLMYGRLVINEPLTEASSHIGVILKHTFTLDQSNQ